MNYKNKSWNEFQIDYMKSFDTEVPIYTPSVYREFRGEIFTTYHSNLHPVNSLIKDCNIHNRFSKSYKNVLRGLHYDWKTSKLVQAIVGEIYIVVLDIREHSKTYGKWESYILSESTRDQILIPPGYANGHYAITDCVWHYTMFYKGPYVDVESQGQVKWNDSKFKITWPTENPVLAGRDI